MYHLRSDPSGAAQCTIRALQAQPAGAAQQSVAGLCPMHGYLMALRDDDVSRAISSVVDSSSMIDSRRAERSSYVSWCR